LRETEYKRGQGSFKRERKRDKEDFVERKQERKEEKERLRRKY
jgi:hypothetical protein